MLNSDEHVSIFDVSDIWCFVLKTNRITSNLYAI